VTIEIGSREQAELLCETFVVPEEDLDQRAAQMAEGLICELERKKEAVGNVCSHYGGDYWFHFDGASKPSCYFCNIVPAPPGLLTGSINTEGCRETVRRFLRDRNTYFERARRALEE